MPVSHITSANTIDQFAAHMNEISDQFNSLQVNATFATNTYVNIQLGTKASNTYVNGTFATNTYVNAQLATKASNNDVEILLASAASNTYVNTQLATKASTTSVALKLAKSNDTAVNLTSSGNTTISGSLITTGIVTPAQITTDQNDYAPSGIGSASVLRVSSSALKYITGIAGGQVAGRVLYVTNIGTQVVTLKDSDAGSTAANRFATNGYNVAIYGGQNVTLLYDGTLSRWVVLSGPGPFRQKDYTSNTYASATYLAKASNLSDLASASTARTSLGLGTGALLDVASTSQFWANTANKLITTDHLNAVGAYATLTDGATITPDMATGANFTVTIAGNRTLANPTNTVVGRSGHIEVLQDASGGHTLSFGTSYKFDTGTAPSIDTTASHRTVLYYHVRASNIILLSMPFLGAQ
jgi:hypothetical protein